MPLALAEGRHQFEWVAIPPRTYSKHVTARIAAVIGARVTTCPTLKGNLIQNTGEAKCVGVWKERITVTSEGAATPDHAASTRN